MSYTVEAINGCTKKLVFKFDSVDLGKEIETALQRKQAASNIKGFRKGKAPISMIREMYGPQVKDEALYQFVSKEFYEAIQKENIQALGAPSFSNTDFKGESVAFEATIEHMPEISTPKVKGLSFEREADAVTDEDVESTIKNFLNEKAELKEITDDSRTIENGIHAVIDFEGERENGERPENMKGQEYVLEIGSNSFIPGFEEGLIGAKKGEEKNLELSFPEDYHVDELKGTKVTFKVNVHELKEKITPELTDELAKEFGHESSSAMMDMTRQRLVSEKQRGADQKLHQDILDKLIADSPFDIPSTLVQSQKKHLIEDMTGTLKSRGFTEDMAQEYVSKWNDDFEQKAVFQVKSGLVLDSLAKSYKVEVTDEAFEEKLKQIGEQSGMSVEEVKNLYTKNPRIKENLTYGLREELTFEAIKSDITIDQK